MKAKTNNLTQGSLKPMWFLDVKGVDASPPGFKMKISISFSSGAVYTQDW